MKITAPDGQQFKAKETLERGVERTSGFVGLAVEIPDPQLWWPNGYGGQPLYLVKVSVLCDAVAKKQLLDEKSYQIGLRTIELRQQEDQWGRSFDFLVNGVRILAKGSNWIPADSFPTRITDSFLEGLIRSAAETHQNMLRVWGG